MEELISDKKFYGLLNNQYCLIERIGLGATSKVYSANKLQSEELYEKRKYAIKVSKSGKNFEKEVEIMKKIRNNKGIITFIESGIGQIEKFSKANKSKPKTISFIVMEYAENGELFDYIKAPGCGFGEKVGKLLFLQLANALLFCHNLGVAHRDIKTENILIDDNFGCKLSDFGFATNITGKSKHFDCVGTESYQAPELLYDIKKGYNPLLNDVFALGIVLFIIVNGFKPFKNALKCDNLYKFIWKCDYESYWYYIEKSTSANQLTKEFKDLFIQMVTFNPFERITLSEIGSHAWIKEHINFPIEDLIKDENFVKEFTQRNLNVMLYRKKKFQK